MTRAGRRAVGPGYFSAVGIPLVSGRDFRAEDRLGAPRVAVVNEQMARFYFGDRNPIGARIQPQLSGEPVALTIIGVARDARDHDLRNEVRRRMYVSFLQPLDGQTSAKYAVQADVAPAVMAKQLRAAVAAVAPRMPIDFIKPVAALVDETLLRERMVAVLSLLLGGVAVSLACIGLYGVLTYAVLRRTNEIGIRLAMGAVPRDVVWMVVRETFVLVLAGAAIGLPVALALGRFVESLLFRLVPHDGWTIAGVLALMAIVALAASILPARRAAAVDPLRALRYE